MNKIFFLAVAAAFTACSTQPMHTKIAPNDVNIQYVGRVVANSDSVVFTYPGTSVFLHFTGSSLSLMQKPNSGYYMVEIDGGEAKKVASNGDSLLVVADSLGANAHTARIMYVVEGYELKPAIYSYILAADQKLIEPLPLPERKILFIGNSITCGYGVEDSIPENHFTYDTENHYYTYAALTASKLNAQHHAIARSGIGIYRNYGDKREGSVENMPYKFKQTLFDNPNYEWKMSDYEPNIICINLGTNDTSLDNYDIDAFRSSYVAFVEQLRTYYPESKILLLCGSMLNGKAMADVVRSLDVVVAECAAKGDSSIYRFDFTPQDGSLGYGSDYHPSLAQQRKMADELTPYISELMSWK
ncbi:MAG: lipase [Bacteroidales bacterium]|nr:lipase [Bacteroidales bacterium]